MTPRRDAGTKPERADSPPPGKLFVIDTLLQSSVVAVFHSFGVATAPLAPMQLSADDLGLTFPVGVMAFRAKSIDAALILSIPKPVSERLDIGRGRQPDARDLLRELTNLIMGRLKNRLTLYQVTATSSLPICRDRMSELEAVVPKAGALMAYRFRTLGGTVVLALKGTVDESRLVYSSTVQINAEGDIILF